MEDIGIGPICVNVTEIKSDFVQVKLAIKIVDFGLGYKNCVGLWIF